MHILKDTNYIFSKSLKNNFWKTLVYTASIVAVGLLFLAITLLPKLGDITASAHQPDLRVLKTANKEVVKPGEIIKFTISVTNDGDPTFISGHNDMTAYNVNIVDNLPNGFVTIPGNETSLNWNISQLEAGETWIKTFDVKVKENIALGGYLNIVTVNAQQKINGSLVTYPAVQASWAVIVEAPNGEPEENPVCVLTQKTNRTIVDFPDDWRLIANNSNKNSYGPVSLSQTLPVGKYDVTLMSYDDHDNKPSQNQLNESYFVKLYNSAGANIFVSNSLPDLPENQNTLVASVNLATAINETSTSISVRHSVSVGANSIRPVCAAFDFIEEEPQLPQLTVIKNLINNNGGTATVSDFRLFVGGEEVISGAVNTFNPGSYNVSEINLSGYTASVWSGDCEPDGNIVLNAGDNKLCTITNNDIYIPPVFPVLNIEKTTNKNVITAGEVVTFTIVVNNTGNGSADNLTLLDVLPEGFTVLNTGNSTIQWNLTSLDPGGSWIKSFSASSATNLGNGTYVNTATVSANNHGTLSDTASVIIQNPPVILTNPSLSIQKTVTPQTTNAGTMVSYTIMVTNSGNGTAFNAVLSDQLPSASFTYTATGTSARSWNLGNILSGESKSTIYTVNIADSVANGAYVNTATVSANNHGTISDTAIVQVQGKVLGEEFYPVLLIEKVADRNRVNPGASVIYIIKVTNAGEADAVELKLSDVLPEDFSEVDTGNTTLEWSLPLLKMGDTWQVSYTVKISEDAIEADYINLAIVSAQNHPKQVKDDYVVEVRKGAVLGDTGVTPLQIFTWIMSLVVLALAVFQIIRKRQFARQLI